MKKIHRGKNVFISIRLRTITSNLSVYLRFVFYIQFDIVLMIRILASLALVGRLVVETAVEYSLQIFPGYAQGSFERQRSLRGC